MSRAASLRRFFLLVVPLGAAVFAPVRAAGLAWERTETSLSAREGDESVEAVYPVKNTGDKAIRIKSIDTGCGCVSARLAGDEVPPGGSAELKAIFRLEGRTGPQTKVINVLADGRDEPLRLLLKVDIVSPVTLRPRMLFWRVGEAPEAKSIEVTLAPGEEIVLGDVVGDTPAFTAAWEPASGPGPARLLVKPASTAQAALCPLKMTVHVQGRKRVVTLYALVR